MSVVTPTAIKCPECGFYLDFIHWVDYTYSFKDNKLVRDGIRGEEFQLKCAMCGHRKILPYNFIDNIEIG